MTNLNERKVKLLTPPQQAPVARQGQITLKDAPVADASAIGLTPSFVDGLINPFAGSGAD
jgi:hypothetical protein